MSDFTLSNYLTTAERRLPIEDQLRLLLDGDVRINEAAELLGISKRTAYRLKLKLRVGTPPAQTVTK